MNKKDLSKDYIQQMVCGIKEDIEIAINSSNLLEKNFWSSNDFFTHYELHVCGSWENYTGKPISIKTGNQKEYKSRILFPFMTLQQYSRRANYFLDEVKAGRSTEPLTDSNSIGWKTTKYWGKKTNYVLVKFRLSKLKGPKEDGLIEYLMYEPIFSSTPTKVVDGNVSYSYFKKIDTRVLSYGLCLNNDIKSLFPVAEELPENNTAEIQNEDYYINNTDGKTRAFNLKYHGETPVSSISTARTVREGLLTVPLTGGKVIGYHGSDIEFDTFDKSKITKRTDGIHGFYFSPEKRKAVAASYGPLKAYELVMENPLYLYRGFDIEDGSVVNSSGHDGIIVIWSGDSTKDSYSSDGYLSDGDIIEMIVFEPEQIKPIKVPKDTKSYLFGTAGESGGEEKQKFNESLEDEFEITDEPVEINNLYELIPTSEGLLELVVKEGTKKIDEELLTPEERKKIISVVLPNSLEEIGESTFDGCALLTYIDIPSSVTSIGDNAFFDCHNLTSITIPPSITTIGDNTFALCSSLTSITVPPSITSIGMGAFYGCYRLTSLSIPPSVTTIGASAFYICIQLTSITIPSSVEEIGSSAFYGCSGLESIYISSSVRAIKDFAFDYCSSLRDIFVTGCNSLEEQEQFKIKLKPALANSYRRVTLHFDAPTITESLEKTKENILYRVGDVFSGAFFVDDLNYYSESDTGYKKEDAKTYQVDLQGARIFDPIKKYNMDAITWDAIWTTEETLKELGLQNEYSADEETDGWGVTSTSSLALAGKRLGYDLTILRDIPSNSGYGKNFNEYVIYNLSLIKEIDPKQTELEEEFVDTEVEFEITDETIDLNSFDVNNFRYPEDMSREYSLEEQKQIKRVIVSEGTTKIESQAFLNFSLLEEVIIPEGVKEIGNAAFAFCESLVSIMLPSTITEIGSEAFSNCTSLESITLPEGITIINNNTFAKCSSLKTITIPNSVTTIGFKAFYRCSLLSSININKTRSKLKSINHYAFNDCSSLKSLTFPNISGVLVIGEGVFSGCSSLERLDFHTIDVVFTTWFTNTFDQCSSLQSISGPVKLIKRLIPSILAQPAIKDIYITGAVSKEEQRRQVARLGRLGLELDKVNIHYESTLAT